MGKILDLNENVNLSEIINNSEYILLDFYADWCEPCKQLFSTLEQLSNEHEDLLIYKVNIELHNDICKQYRIMGVPNLILLKNGEVKRQISGSQTLNSLERLFD